MSQAMTRRKNDAAPAVGKLLKAVCENGIQHLHEAEADLMQAMFIFDEAIEKVGQHFTAIHQAVDEQQSCVDALLLESDVPARLADSKQLADFRDLREVIGDEVNAAVIGLQFHDLTSQLIARTLRRIGEMRSMLQVCKHCGEEMETAPESAEAALGAIHEVLQRSDRLLDRGSPRPVQQRHMGCGEIELF
jgi:uncharacterized protein YhaN